MSTSKVNFQGSIGAGDNAGRMSANLNYIIYCSSQDYLQLYIVNSSGAYLVYATFCVSSGQGIANALPTLGLANQILCVNSTATGLSYISPQSITNLFTYTIPVNISTAGSNTLLTSLNYSMPNYGGPFRIVALYNFTFNFSNPCSTEFWIYDGTNVLCQSGGGTSASNGGMMLTGSGVSQISFIANQILALQLYCFTNNGPATLFSTSAISSRKSYMQLYTIFA